MSILLGLGSVVGGAFRIEKPLRSGGMGDVFVAHQLGLDRPCALKLMQANLARDPRFRERFAREAKLATQIESDHVVKVLAAGIDEASGTPWIAMELLRGAELSEHLAERGALPEGEAVEVLAQIAHAVGAAHAQGIVHRDLKPENVFLADSRAVAPEVAAADPAAPRYTVKILDFGIAKVISETQMSSTASIGSPTWMAPEQTMRGKAVSPATDVWAMGLIAFRMLTGESYWLSLRDAEATPMMVVSEMMFEPLEPASVRARALGVKSALPPWFDAWFARCVARDAAARYATATEAFTALEELQRSPPEVVDIPIDVPPRPRGLSRSPAAGVDDALAFMPTQPIGSVSNTRIVAVSEKPGSRTGGPSGPLELGSVKDDPPPLPPRSNTRTFLLVGLSAAVLVGLFVLSNNEGKEPAAPSTAASNAPEDGVSLAESARARVTVAESPSAMRATPPTVANEPDPPSSEAPTGYKKAPVPTGTARVAKNPKTTAQDKKSVKEDEVATSTKEGTGAAAKKAPPPKYAPPPPAKPK
ncbi:MAG: serine/threonine-protein kinase [Polyangiaceae bacterium]